MRRRRTWVANVRQATCSTSDDLVRKVREFGANSMGLPHDLYLDLMMRCLTDWIYDGVDERVAPRAATGRRGRTR